RRRRHRLTSVKPSRSQRGEGDTVAEEQVTSPDQHRPSNIRATRLAGLLAIVVLLAMLYGNHDGIISGDGSAWVEDASLIGLAALIAVMLVGDAVLRRRGLRR